MKKLFTIFPLLLALLILLSACGQAPTDNTTLPQVDESESKIENPEDTAQSSENKKDTLVVVFSATGTTKAVAERIAALIDADLYEIKAAQPYTSADLDWQNQNSRTTIEQNDSSVRPEIGSESIDLAGYKTVYLGYPIWFGQAPRILSTFAEGYDFTGITVIPFCTSGSSDIGQSDDALAEQAGSGNWLPGKRFPGSVSDADLQSWIEKQTLRESTS